MRIRGAKTELEEAGLETEGMVESTSKLRDMIKQMTGFDIMADEDTFKDIYDIVVGIGSKWQDLTDVDQAALLEALAEKRQGNALAAALSNIDTLQAAYQSAKNSAGSAMRENARYLESIEARLNILKSESQELATALIDSDLVKFFLDVGNAILSGTNNLAGFLNEIYSLGGILDNTAGGGLGTLIGILTSKSGTGLIRYDADHGLITWLDTLKKSVPTVTAEMDEFLETLQITADSGKLELMDYKDIEAMSVGLVDLDENFEDFISNIDHSRPIREQYIQFLKNSESGAVKLTTALKTVGATIANVLASAAIGIAVQAIITGLDKLIDTADEVQSRVNNLMEEFNSAITEANNKADYVDSIAQKYEKLSQGVNGLGENISLAAEEYEEYNSLVNEIAEKFPELIQGYTDEGTAILSLKGNIDELTNSYKQAQIEAYNLLIATGKDGTGKDIVKNWNNALTSGFWDVAKDFGAADVGGAISYKDAVAQLTVIRDMSAETYRNLKAASETGGNRQALLNLTPEERAAIYDPQGFLFKVLGGRLTSNISDADYNRLKADVEALITTYETNINAALSNVTSLANAYMNVSPDYIALDSQTKTAASLIVNSIDSATLEAMSNGGKLKQEDVAKYVNNVIDVLANNKEAKAAITGLFTVDTSQMSVGDVEEFVNKEIEIIANALDEDPLLLKVRLGFDNKDVEADVAAVKAKIADEFDGNVESLTEGDLAIAVQIVSEIPEDTLLTWDELTTKIAEAKTSAEESAAAFIDMGNGVKYTKEQYQEMMGLGEDWGDSVDNGKEYAAVLKTISSQTDAADKAIKEYIKEGRISQSTVDSLTNANEGYAKAIEYTKDGIVLKTEALKDLVKEYANVHISQLQNQIDLANEAKAHNSYVMSANSAMSTYGLPGAASSQALLARNKDLEAQNVELDKNIKEWQGQIDYYNNLVAGVGTDTGETPAKNTKDFTSNTNTYNWEDAWLKDQQAQIDKLKADGEKINAQLQKAIEAGDEEQIKLLTDLALKKSAELRSKYAEIAKEGRGRYDNIMARIYAIAPELAGKGINEITQAEITAATKRLDDAIVAEENKAIAMYNADNNVKDPNKAGIEAAKNNKAFFTSYLSEAQEYFKAFEYGNGTYAEAWAAQVEKDSETIKSEFEALNAIFDKQIDENTRKLDSLDLRIELLDEDDYVNKIDLITQKSEQNANTQQKLADEITKVSREFGNGEIPAEEYEKRIDELTDSYNECVKSAQSFEIELKDIAGQQISDITSIESDVKSYLEDYVALVEDSTQKEIDQAEKAADAKKKALDAQKKGLQDYQDELEKQWDKEDERVARREKLDERNEKAKERAKALTAAASGDLEALSRVQDLDSEIEKLDKEIQDQINEQWRDDVKDYIADQVEELEKQSDKLDDQLQVMKEQLEATQKTNEELLKGESGYAMVHALMAGGTVKIGNNEVDLNTIMQRLADESGDSSRYGYTYENATWQQDLSNALISVGNLEKLNDLATGNFSLQNGVIILGDGSRLDLNTLTGRQPMNDYNSQLLDNSGTMLPAASLRLGQQTYGAAKALANPDMMNKIITQQAALNENLNRLLDKSSNVTVGNLLNIEGDITEDVLPKIRQVIAQMTPEALSKLWDKSISAGFSRAGVTGKSKWYK